MKRGRSAMLAAALAALMLTGCAALERQDPSARLAVQYGALKYIGEDPARADRVRSLAIDVLDTIDRGSVTLSLVDQAVRAQIDWQSLDTADRLLLDALLVALRDELEVRFGTGMLDSDASVQVRTVVAWVIQAADLVA